MSLWSVYDIPTRNLMVEFVTALKNRQPPDVALQSAMRKVKAQYAHPVYWAGFMIYGTPNLGYY
jgi:CHAT domain-containing protein